MKQALNNIKLRFVQKYSCSFKLIILLFAVSTISCSRNSVPDNAQQLNVLPQIFPDYTNVAVPYNIAPPNFKVEEDGSAYLISISGKNGKTLVCKSNNGVADIPIKKWKKIADENKGEELKVHVAVEKNGIWEKYKAFGIYVAPHPIDSHLSYRLINVGYILWKKMGLYQRDITGFTERPIMLNRNSEGNCMNCHSYSNYNPAFFSFHMRGKHSGTIISTPDSVFKVETKTPYTLASAAYTAWHPQGKHIAFSVDVVRQFFHGVIKDNEVYDHASDLIVYDIEKNMVTTHPLVSTKLREVLPNWSPDGKHLYFTAAPSYYDSLNFDEVYYDLMRIEFDAASNTFGKLDTVYQASKNKRTLSFPKISPDGKQILFTGASHGYFTIYNQTSDLYLLNLASGTVEPYPFNSSAVESYHEWSSNGRWVVFSSKRIDGLTTRPFISYYDEKGKWYKPFVLPQKDPLFYRSFNLNYNIPHLSDGAVTVNRQQLLKAVWGEAKQAQFDSNVDVDALSGASKIEKGTSLH